MPRRPKANGRASDKLIKCGEAPNRTFLDRSNTKLPRSYGFDPLSLFLRTAPSQYHTLLLIFYFNAAVKDSYEP
ncbi:hypothetical protein Bca4012_000806 [Brassica carinata]